MTTRIFHRIIRFRNDTRSILECGQTKIFVRNNAKKFTNLKLTKSSESIENGIFFSEIKEA